MRGASVIEPVLALGVWWSVWSIADFYLLSYSPYGELLVLAACLLGFVVAANKRESPKR